MVFNNVHTFLSSNISIYFSNRYENKYKLKIELKEIMISTSGTIFH